MKLCFMNMESYGSVDFPKALERITGPDGQRIKMINYPFSNTDKRTDPEFEERFINDLKKDEPDAVFSFNYYPLISLVCNRADIPYISVVYDNPLISLYSYTVINKCNHVYVFDSQVAEDFNSKGISTIHYLPLAAGVRRMEAMVPDRRQHDRFDADIAFVGSLYTEEHTFYDRMEPKLDDYTRGYLDAVMAAQLKIDGMNFVEKCLTQPVLEKMIQAYPMMPNSDGVETSAWIYANYMLNRKITQTERPMLLKLIGEKLGNEYDVAVYTKDTSFDAMGIQNRGLIDYYDEMPYAFKCAKINLNFSLRSITRGIPLRAFDIMGCGGFLLTNYQQDFFDLFVPDEDFVFYESNEDLIDKLRWYLKHDEERIRIAKNGHDKVAKEHTWEIRLQQIFEDVFG